MWTRLRSQHFSKKTIPWIFILVAILAYGLLTPWMGFYWDDWVFVWLLKHNGPVELARSFLPYDPLVSPFFLMTSSIIGTNAFAWQVFGLVTRILVTLTALWTFNQIWPQYSRRNIWAALFFLVYPGYAQQWVAFTHANQEWISFGFFILSLGLTARSLRADFPKRWIVYALIAQFIGLATTEYFLGMEFLRPLVIWIATLQPPRPLYKHMVRTLKQWGMYIPIWLLAGIGQYLYHKSSSYGGHSFGMDLSERGIPHLISSWIKDILPTLRVAAFDAWAQTLNLITSSFSSLTDWLTLLIILVSFIGLAFYLRQLRNDPIEIVSGDSWAMQAIALGLVGVLGGRIPSWLAGLPIVLRFDWDRLLISMLFGISLLTAGLIDYLIKDGNRKQIFISLVIALAMGMQFQQANSFRRAWENQKSFFWQLAWRAPALKPGTMLLAEELPLPYVADLQLSAPLNLVYAPDASKFSYMILYRKNRLSGSFLPKLAPNLPAIGQYRTVKFQSTTSNIVMMVLPSNGCLQLIDPRYASAATLTDVPQAFTENLDLSNIDQVENRNSANPAKYFGAEPPHTWCYYFEKAELARQFDDWDGVIRNYQSAASAGYSPLLPSENLVFLEALVRSGKTDKALDLTQTIIKQDHKLCKALTSTWERTLTASPPVDSKVSKMMEALKDLPECN
ncbi:MAG TPA: hypothetical protein VK909_16730 [Anaerolineales bacterium]|nr:hypothetical protein [Anaerolineales bacterium]